MASTQDLTGIDLILHDLMEGFGRDYSTMFRALCIGFKLKLFTVGEASPTPGTDLGPVPTDSLVAEIRGRLIDRGLLPGGPGLPVAGRVAGVLRNALKAARATIKLLTRWTGRKAFTTTSQTTESRSSSSLMTRRVRRSAVT